MSTAAERLGQMAATVMDAVEALGGELGDICFVYEVEMGDDEVKTYVEHEEGEDGAGKLLRRDLVGLLEMGKIAVVEDAYGPDGEELDDDEEEPA